MRITQIFDSQANSNSRDSNQVKIISLQAPSDRLLWETHLAYDRARKSTKENQTDDRFKQSWMLDVWIWKDGSWRQCRKEVEFLIDINERTHRQRPQLQCKRRCEEARHQELQKWVFMLWSWSRLVALSMEKENSIRHGHLSFVFNANRTVSHCSKAKPTRQLSGEDMGEVKGGRYRNSDVDANCLQSRGALSSCREHVQSQDGLAFVRQPHRAGWGSCEGQH